MRRKVKPEVIDHTRELVARGKKAHDEWQVAFDAWAADWQARVSELRDARTCLLRANPRRIPRNHRIEAAIEAAREGDFTPFQRLDSALRAPFDEREEWADLALAPQPDEIVHRTFCGT